MGSKLKRSDEPKLSQMSFFENGICLASENDITRAMNIESVMLLRKPIQKNDLRRVLLERALRVPRLRSLIRKDRRGAHFYEDVAEPERMIDQMIHEHHLKTGSLNELQEFQSSVLFKPWSAELPQWEVYMINNVSKCSLSGEEVGMALLFRLNHALGDGYALSAVLLSLTDEGDIREPVSKFGGSSLLRQESSNLDPLQKGFFSKMMSWIMTFLYIFPTLWIAAVETELNDTDTAIKWKKSSRPTTKKTFVVTKEFPLDKVKAVAKGGGATINDALMAFVAGGIRRYLLKLGDPAVQTKSWVRTVMVTSMRKQTMEDVEFANKLTFLPIPMPVSLPDFPSRLQKVKSYLDFIKASPAGVVIYYLQQLFVWVAGARALQWKIARTQKQQTFAISNLPGPRQKVSICGSTVEQIMFWTNPANMPLMVSIISYASKVSIMCCVDPQIIKDPHSFVQCFEEEVSDTLASL